MAKGDRTGPSGQGPGTGRAIGYCYGFDTPGYAKGQGRGMGSGMGRRSGMGRSFAMGRGFGGGRGFGAHYPGSTPGPVWSQALSREDEIKMLKNQSEALKRSQKDIEKRLDELEKE